MDPEGLLDLSAPKDLSVRENPLGLLDLWAQLGREIPAYPAYRQGRLDQLGQLDPEYQLGQSDPGDLSDQSDLLDRKHQPPTHRRHART